LWVVSLFRHLPSGTLPGGGSAGREHWPGTSALIKCATFRSNACRRGGGCDLQGEVSMSIPHHLDSPLRGLIQEWPLLVSTLIRHAALYHPQREIVSHTVEGTLHRCNWSAVAQRARQLAQALWAAGVRPGERVATLAWNTYRHLELFYGVTGIAAVLHTVNPRLFDEQIRYILRHGAARILCVDLTFLPIVARLLDQLPELEQIVVLAAPDDLPPWEGRIALQSYEAFIAAHDGALEWPTFDEYSAAALCYTSGTTGDPKGVLYSHRSTVLHAFGAAQRSAMGLDCTDTIIAVAPMYHANAWAMPYIAAMVGAKLVLPGPHHDPQSIVDLINGEGATFACGVPTIWTLVLQHLRATGQRLERLERTTIGGSAVSQAMIDGLADYGVRVLHLWGMTEMSPLGTVATPTPEVQALPAEQQRLQYAKQGRAQYAVELQLKDVAGRAVSHDGVQSADLWVRGPWVCSAYFRREDEGLLDADGWFPTGDVATIDALGFMKITDRTKDVIKSGGEWISSIELENAAAGHPAVSLVAVIAMPDPKWEERPLMVVELLAGHSVTLEEMRGYLEGRVARWWLPDALRVVDKMPLTATGKIRKTALRELLLR
jgi:acyl-CoA synthetase (AMP-forming)/AMP-acid ligase II